MDKFDELPAPSAPHPDDYRDETGLTLNERKLLAALTTETNFKVASVESGIGLARAKRIFLTSPAFREAYNSLYGGARKLVKHLNEVLVPAAMARLESLIDSDDERVALSAIRTILTIAGEVSLDGGSGQPIVNIFNVINQVRQDRGLPPLLENEPLSQQPHPLEVKFREILSEPEIAQSD